MPIEYHRISLFHQVPLFCKVQGLKSKAWSPQLFIDIILLRSISSYAFIYVNIDEDTLW